MPEAILRGQDGAEGGMPLEDPLPPPIRSDPAGHLPADHGAAGDEMT